MTLPKSLISRRSIEVCEDGPYAIHGEIPLVHKTQIVSEAGEPLAWRKDGEIDAQGEYCLCRCGHSKDMPFCDGTHNEVEFDGTEEALTGSSLERREEYPPCGGMSVSFDNYLCSDSGFCGNRASKIAELAGKLEDIQVRTQVIAMIEHCPSGALTYRFTGETADNEVDLPEQIAVVTEITAQGPIRGPLWVTGGIPVIKADGQPLEVRNRVTLCCCGKSHSKPLCDGSHRTGS